MDLNIPGGVYLCQVKDTISCGACCGLYNVSDPSFENLSAILQTRTRLYDQTPKTYDDLEAFAAKVLASENPQRPYPDFHHCPYIGLIGESQDRPGCLLHPLGKGNKNTDFRGLSHWGGFACASYFCPTCHETPARYKDILKSGATNWYDYGLIITENEYISTYFQCIEDKLGQDIVPKDLMENTGFLALFHDFLQLKTTWPYKPEGYNQLGNYFFKDNCYPRCSLEYHNFDLDTPKTDIILKTLGTHTTHRATLLEAIEKIDHLIDQTVCAIKNRLI